MYFLLQSLLEWNISNSLDTSKKSKHNLDDFFLELELQVESMLKLKDVKLSFKYDDNSFLEIKKASVQAILRNVLTNAIKHSQLDSEVRISYLKESDLHVFEIIDEGSGMSQDIVEKLYSNLELNSIEKGTSSVDTGFGFGGSIVCKLVNDLSGEISVNSIINKGTIVTVKIP